MKGTRRDEKEEREGVRVHPVEREETSSHGRVHVGSPLCRRGWVGGSLLGLVCGRRQSFLKGGVQSPIICKVVEKRVWWVGRSSADRKEEKTEPRNRGRVCADRSG